MRKAMGILLLALIYFMAITPLIAVSFHSVNYVNLVGLVLKSFLTMGMTPLLDLTIHVYYNYYNFRDLVFTINFLTVSVGAVMTGALLINIIIFILDDNKLFIILVILMATALFYELVYSVSLTALEIILSYIIIILNRIIKEGKIGKVIILSTLITIINILTLKSIFLILISFLMIKMSSYKILQVKIPKIQRKNKAGNHKLVLEIATFS